MPSVPRGSKSFIASFANAEVDPAREALAPPATQRAERRLKSWLMFLSPCLCSPFHPERTLSNVSAPMMRLSQDNNNVNWAKIHLRNGQHNGLGAYIYLEPQSYLGFLIRFRR